MNVTPIPCLALAAVGLVPLLASNDGAEVESTDLSLKKVSNWEFVLPRETWKPVDGEIVLDGIVETFVAERTGEQKIELDTNGDGKVDHVIRGADGEATLRGRAPDGERASYPVRIRFEGGAYQFAPGGVASGKLGGVQVKFIDQNANGRFDEVGVDAMTVGADKGASYLSSVANLGGDLYELEVAPDGRSATATPYTGEVGSLDLASKFDCRGKLVSAIVRDGDLSFNVAGTKGFEVPAGEYRLEYGFARKGEETVEISGGKMIPLVVEAGETRTMDWGGPIVAEVGYTRAGDTFTVGTGGLRFFGTAGEEYTRFLPEAKSPKILVYDAETGKLLDSGRFAGC